MPRNPRPRLDPPRSVEWATPAKVYAALDAEFRFDLDPCPLGSADDGLALEWRGRRVFCNPPYGDIAPWLEKGREADVAVFLVPARTDVRWFHGLVLPFASDIRFVRGRLRFGNGANNGAKHRGKVAAPFANMILVFRKGVIRNGERAFQWQHLDRVRKPGATAIGGKQHAA